jgi:MarR-like DNA-binding transcriptional regulator SgrR of sgrS sRNA
VTPRDALRLALALGTGAPLAKAALGPLYGGDIVVSVPVLPASLEPAEAEDAAHRLALGLVHETLLTLDEVGRIGPGLARAELRAASGREWRLELQPGARFHDDAVLTSADALRSLRRFLEVDAGAELREALEPDGVWAPDAGHVVLRFRDPPPQGPLGLASPAAAVTSPGGAGAGPFVPTLRVAGRRLALTAFASHLRGRPYLDRVTLVAQPDPARRSADVAGGRADAALDAVPARPLATAHATLVLVLDPSRPPCDNPEVRDALAAAATSAEVASFVPGALAASPPTGAVGRLLPEPLWLVVAADVPPAASRRLAAVLESLGTRVSLDVLSPREARRAPAPVRLVLDPPAPRDAATVVALARLPIQVAARPGLHGLRLGADGRLVLEAAWVEP